MVAAATLLLFLLLLLFPHSLNNVTGLRKRLGLVKMKYFSNLETGASILTEGE